jgi:hypothetical protein
MRIWLVLSIRMGFDRGFYGVEVVATLCFVFLMGSDEG